MIRINLLPVRVSRRQEAVKRDLILGGIGLGAVLLVCGAFYVLLAAKVNEVSAENDRLSKDLENLKAIVARVDEIEKFNEELKRKLAVIDELRANKVGPVHLLDELSSATPEKLYLKSLREKQKKVSLEGFAASNEVISQYLTNLEKSDWFDDVYLGNIEEQQVGNFKLKFFEITARMVVPTEKAKKNAEKNAAKQGDGIDALLPGEKRDPNGATPAPGAPPAAGGEPSPTSAAPTLKDAVNVAVDPAAPPPAVSDRPMPRGADAGE